MKTEFINQVLKLAREAGPEIERALAGVEDVQLRAALAGAVMQRILAEISTGAGATGGAAKFGIPVANSSKVERTGGTQGRILDLRADQFFAEPRQLEQVLEELQVRGYHHNKSDVRMSLLRLTRRKLLRRIVYGEGRQRTFYYVSP